MARPGESGPTETETRLRPRPAAVKWRVQPALLKHFIGSKMSLLEKRAMQPIARYGVDS